MVWQVSMKDWGGSCTSGQIGPSKMPKEKALAKARHKEGGYSFKIVVLQWPNASHPTARARGRSLQTRCWWRYSIMLCMLMTRRSVGFRVGAPIRPCAKRRREAPGSWMITSIKARRQMEAASSRSSGSAGCSRIPKACTAAISIIASIAKPRRMFPMSIWCSSRMGTLSKPQGSELSRITRGMKCPFALCPTALTLDHVSQGGPPKNAITHFDLMASNQKRLMCGSAAFPHVPSTMTSREMMWMTYVCSCCASSRSRKYWRSPTRRRPLNACKTQRCRPNWRGTFHCQQLSGLAARLAQLACQSSIVVFFCCIPSNGAVCRKDNAFASHKCRNLACISFKSYWKKVASSIPKESMKKSKVLFQIVHEIGWSATKSRRRCSNVSIGTRSSICSTRKRCNSSSMKWCSLFLGFGSWGP